MKPEPRPTMLFVSSIQICRGIVNFLLQQKQIAVDFEGVALGRHGILSIIQIGTESGDIFLFDIIALGESAFWYGGLRQLLQSEEVLKVIFDGRSDNDALHYLFNSRMINVFDLQIQHSFKLGDQSDPCVKSLSHCLTFSNVMSLEEKTRFSFLKDIGKAAPSTDWIFRPIHPAMIEYATEDVKYMLSLKSENERFNMLYKWNDKIKALSQKRIDNAIKRNTPSIGAKRDFSIPDTKGFAAVVKHCIEKGISENKVHPRGHKDGDIYISNTAFNLSKVKCMLGIH